MLLGITKEVEQKYNDNGRNTCHIYEHGWSEKDSEIYENVQKAFENRQANRTNEVLEGDRVIIKDKTGKHIFFNYGVVEKQSWHKSGFGVCENGSVHVGLTQDNTLPSYFSISGGSFFSVDTKDLKYIGECERVFWTWGSCGACGNGGIYIPCKVNCYELITDKEFIPYEIFKLYNSDFGYKYKLQARHSNNINGLGGCFKTRSGLIKYLRNHKMKITGRLNNSLKVEVNSEFKRVIINNVKEFNTILQKCDNSFAELRNGNYWRTCTIGNTQYLPNYLEQFKLDYFACSNIYG